MALLSAGSRKTLESPVMKLPNADRVIVDQRKVIEYLLSSSHPDGWAKAEFFGAFGFKAENWQVLARALKEHCGKNSVTKVVESEYGTRYTVDGVIETPSGRKPTIRTVWIVGKGKEIPRLITAHPA